jgi:hypothetical protein
MPNRSEKAAFDEAMKSILRGGRHTNVLEPSIQHHLGCPVLAR